jgi:uncharacterized protein (TIGR00730 family)
MKKEIPLQESLSSEMWRIFRMIAEFVDGTEIMHTVGPSIAFFGSSVERSSDDPYYELARILAQKIAQNGFTITTGGSFGIMEAANKGAKEVNGKSCGLCIDLPEEEKPNEFIDKNYLVKFRHFFIRKVMFVKYAQAFVVFPGGYGTIDELFESLNLIQTKKTKKFPVFLVGSEYWKGLVEWLQKMVLVKGNISREDFALFQVIDDPDQIAEEILRHYNKTKNIQNF